MYHYTYIIESENGKYYVGRHSTKNIDDGYLGSGKWIRSLKDRSAITKRIISFYDSFDDLVKAESQLLNEHVGKHNCMNFNNQPVGFSSGSLNPATRDDQKEKCRSRFLADNPSKREDIRLKKSNFMSGRTVTGKRAKGYRMTDEERARISSSRVGIKISEEGRRKLSESRKRQYQLGERSLPSMKGKKHTEEAKKLVSESALSRPKLTCPHCNIEVKPHTYKRWHGENCKDLVKAYIIAREKLEEIGLIPPL